MKGILEYMTPDSYGSCWLKHIGNGAVYMSECTDGKIGNPKEWTKEKS